MAPLTPQQKINSTAIVNALKAKGITNRFYQSALLGIAYKESFLGLRTESSYSGTSVARIRAVFPTKTKSLTDEQITALKASDEKFFNYIYAGIAGNSDTDGYKFRGRGYNQLTGRANYKAMSQYAGIDLTADPDKVNDPAIAANVLVGYALSTINAARLAEYKLGSLNDIKDIETAVRIAMRQTAGWGKSITGTVFVEGEKKALAFSREVLAANELVAA